MFDTQTNIKKIKVTIKGTNKTYKEREPWEKIWNYKNKIRRPGKCKRVKL